MSSHHLIKIVSGGQTGVDRAGLDAAIFLGLEHGGWCPKGRRAENGIIPERYQLKENDRRDYSVRTEQNVVDSDGTLIMFRHQLSGGTELTYRLAKKHKRPHLCVDLTRLAAAFEADDQEAVQVEKERVLGFLQANNIRVLNVAGPRESTSPGIGKQAERSLVALLKFAET